jgi:hypothetical protein
MKCHSLLSKENVDLMEPLEYAMRESFDRTRSQKLPPNKNYFAVSMKNFLLSLSEDELDLLCHNYIHNWIAEHLAKSNAQANKYAIEPKLQFLQRSNSTHSRRQSDASFQINSVGEAFLTSSKHQPRFMQPTVNRALKIQSHEKENGNV